MAQIMGTWGLYEALQAEGYTLPAETVRVDLGLGVNEVLQMRITVNLTTETAAILGRALQRMALNQSKPAKQWHPGLGSNEY